MIRQQIVVNMTATLLICVIASFSVSRSAASKDFYQTIPDALGVYLPIISKQDPSTPTLTATPTATIALTVKPTLTATPVPTITPTPTSKANCHASYPTVCISPPPPDLDCKDIPYRRFRVLPPDPHNFDSDHDGIGCEG